MEKKRTTMFLKSSRNKENHLCLRNVSICLKKLSEKEILRASKKFIKRQNIKKKQKSSECLDNENNVSESNCISPKNDTSQMASKDISFKCSKCNYFFSEELEFENHYEAVHIQSKNRQIVCSDCLRVFEDREDLFWHCHNTHYELRLHKCSDCEVMSLDRKQIVQHISSFHNKPLFECWACDMIFNVEENLIDHFNEKHFLKS